MPRVPASLDRLDRALVVTMAVAALAALPARANPWNLVVIEDAIEPGLVVLAAIALATLVIRWALRITRVDPAAYEGPLPPIAVALAPYPLLLVGLIVIPVLVWPSAVDAAASIGREPTPDATFPIDGTDLVVEFDHADCFLEIDGTVVLEARRGISSRRIELHRDQDCVEIELSFAEEGNRVSVRAACTVETIAFDPQSLDVLERSTEQLGPDKCVDGRALDPGPMVLPPL